jgi:hypothetical protein
VLDYPDPQAPAAFHSELLGPPITKVDEDWVDIRHRKTSASASSTPPTTTHPHWPDPASPQQFHIDVIVDDIDQAEPKVLTLGATHLPGQGSSFRICADPAGHPFCLCTQ